jgi:hypothetical protein
MLQDSSVEAGRRAARYWNFDGFAELYVGLVWLCTVVIYGVRICGSGRGIPCCSSAAPPPG